MFANPLKRCFKRDINPMNDDLKWSFKGNLRVYIYGNSTCRRKVIYL